MTQPYAFCNYLRGILDASKNDMGLGVDKTTAVKTKLNSVFKHVIDPSYPAHLQPALQQAHSGKNTDNNNGGIPPASTQTFQNKPSNNGGLEILC